MTNFEVKSKRVASRPSAMKHRRLFSAAAVLLAVCLAFVGAAGAVEWYVSPDGSGSEASQTNPSNLTTVLTMIKDDTTNSEYTVYLMNGEYNDNSGYVIDTTRSVSITLKAQDTSENRDVNIKKTLTIQSKNADIRLEGLSFSEITSGAAINLKKSYEAKSLVVDNCNFTNCYQGILTDKGSNKLTSVEVLNSNFTLCGWAVYGGFVSANSFTISSCKIIDCNYGLYIRQLKQATKATINDNEITTKYYCIRTGEMSNDRNIGSFEVKENKLTSLESYVIDCQAKTQKDLVIQENVLVGETILRFAKVSEDDITSLDIDKNYWNGENPVGKDALGEDSPLISWGNLVPPEEPIEYYYKLNEDGSVDRDSKYSGSTHIIYIETEGFGEIELDPLLYYGYPIGSEVTITAKPGTGYSLSSLKVIDEDGTEIDVVENNKFTMPAKNVTVTASFTANTYNIEVIDGSAEPEQAEINTEVTLIPDIKEGYTFKEWSVMSEGDITITGNKFTMPASDVSIKAVFEENPVDEPSPSTSSGSGSEGNYLSYPRTTVNGGLVDFGSSKAVKAVLLPEGSSGSVVLKVDTIEKWPKELETEYTFDISVEKLGEGMAYIHFEIPVSALESLELTPADICAYHFEGEVWTKLPTTYEVKDGTVCYEAETDSFSPFKLVIEEGAAEPKAEETEPIIPPTEEPEDKPQEELPPIEPPVQPTEPESPSPILAVLAGLGAAAVLRRK